MREVTGRPLGHEAFMRYLDGAVHRGCTACVGRRALAVAAALLVLGAAAGPAAGAAERFRSSVSRSGRALADRMTPALVAPRLPGRPRRPAPGVGAALGLRRPRAERRADRARDAAADVVTVFEAALRGALPDPADAHGRRVRRQRLRLHRGRQHLGLQLPARRPAASDWSEHAYGRAIDINPIENPYVSGGSTSHRASVPYLDRSRMRPGMAVEGGALVRAFDAVGWGWGGRWSGVKDYQHFSHERRLTAPAHAAYPYRVNGVQES